MKNLIANLVLTAALAATGMAVAENPQEVAASSSEYYQGMFYAVGTLGALELNTADGPMAIGSRIVVRKGAEYNQFDAVLALAAADGQSLLAYPIATQMMEFSSAAATENGVTIVGARYAQTATDDQLLEVTVNVQILGANGARLEKLVVSETTKVIASQPREAATPAPVQP